MRTSDHDFITQTMCRRPPEFLLRSLYYLCHLVPTGTCRDIFMWHSKHQRSTYINLLIRKYFWLLNCSISIRREQFLPAAPGKLASVTKALWTQEAPKNNKTLNCSGRFSQFRGSQVLASYMPRPHSPPSSIRQTGPLAMNEVLPLSQFSLWLT